MSPVLMPPWAPGFGAALGGRVGLGTWPLLGYVALTSLSWRCTALRSGCLWSGWLPGLSGRGEGREGATPRLVPRCSPACVLGGCWGHRGAAGDRPMVTAPSSEPSAARGLGSSGRESWNHKG